MTKHSIIRERCPRCGQLSIFFEETYGERFQCQNDNCTKQRIIIDHDEKLDPKEVAHMQFLMAFRRESREQEEFVYYLRWSDRIKIGTSRSIKSRINSLYHDEVLAIEQGGATLEQKRHEQFKQFLIPGQREWFTTDDSLLRHISAVREKFGDPQKIIERGKW